MRPEAFVLEYSLPVASWKALGIADFLRFLSGTEKVYDVSLGELHPLYCLGRVNAQKQV